MEQVAPLRYQICLKCFRAVLLNAGETYCPNDGSRMLKACDYCSAAIDSPYGRFCPSCGLEYGIKHLTGNS